MATSGVRTSFFIYTRTHATPNLRVDILGPGNSRGMLVLTYPPGPEQPEPEEAFSDIPIGFRVSVNKVHVSYVPRWPGHHVLHILCEERPVFGSPFCVNVDDGPETGADPAEWISEEEHRARTRGRIARRKKLTAIYRIVDFVTEKMLMTEDGRLEHLPDGVIRRVGTPARVCVHYARQTNRAKKKCKRQFRKERSSGTPEKSLEFASVSEAFGPPLFENRCLHILRTCSLILKHFPPTHSLHIFRTAESIIARESILPRSGLAGHTVPSEDRSAFDADDEADVSILGDEEEHLSLQTADYTNACENCDFLKVDSDRPGSDCRPSSVEDIVVNVTKTLMFGILDPATVEEVSDFMQRGFPEISHDDILAADQEVAEIIGGSFEHNVGYSSIVGQGETRCSSDMVKEYDDHSQQLDVLPHAETEETDVFKSWSSITEFGEPSSGSEITVDFEPVIAAPNIDEALRQLDIGIQRAEEDRRNGRNGHDGSQSVHIQGYNQDGVIAFNKLGSISLCTQAGHVEREVWGIFDRDTAELVAHDHVTTLLEEERPSRSSSPRPPFMSMIEEESEDTEEITTRAPPPSFQSTLPGISVCPPDVCLQADEHTAAEESREHPQHDSTDSCSGHVERPKVKDMVKAIEEREAPAPRPMQSARMQYLHPNSSQSEDLDFTPSEESDIYSSPFERKASPCKTPESALPETTSLQSTTLNLRPTELTPTSLECIDHLSNVLQSSHVETSIQEDITLDSSIPQSTPPETIVSQSTAPELDSPRQTALQSATLPPTVLQSTALVIDAEKQRASRVAGSGHEMPEENLPCSAAEDFKAGSVSQLQAWQGESVAELVEDSKESGVCEGRDVTQKQADLDGSEDVLNEKDCSDVELSGSKRQSVLDIDFVEMRSGITSIDSHAFHGKYMGNELYLPLKENCEQAVKKKPQLLGNIVCKSVPDSRGTEEPACLEENSDFDHEINIRTTVPEARTKEDSDITRTISKDMSELEGPAQGDDRNSPMLSDDVTSLILAPETNAAVHDVAGYMADTQTDDVPSPEPENESDIENQFECLVQTEHMESHKAEVEYSNLLQHDTLVEALNLEKTSAALLQYADENKLQTNIIYHPESQGKDNFSTGNDSGTVIERASEDEVFKLNLGRSDSVPLGKEETEYVVKKNVEQGIEQNFEQSEHTSNHTILEPELIHEMQKSKESEKTIDRTCNEPKSSEEIQKVWTAGEITSPKAHEPDSSQGKEIVTQETDEAKARGGFKSEPTPEILNRLLFDLATNTKLNETELSQKIQIFDETNEILDLIDLPSGTMQSAHRSIACLEPTPSGDIKIDEESEEITEQADLDPKSREEVPDVEGDNTNLLSYEPNKSGQEIKFAEESEGITLQVDAQLESCQEMVTINESEGILDLKCFEQKSCQKMNTMKENLESQSHQKVQNENQSEEIADVKGTDLNSTHQIQDGTHSERNVTEKFPGDNVSTQDAEGRGVILTGMGVAVSEEIALETGEGPHSRNENISEKDPSSVPRQLSHRLSDTAITAESIVRSEHSRGRPSAPDNLDMSREETMIEHVLETEEERPTISIRQSTQYSDTYRMLREQKTSSQGEAMGELDLTRISTLTPALQPQLETNADITEPGNENDRVNETLLSYSTSVVEKPVSFFPTKEVKDEEGINLDRTVSFPAIVNVEDTVSDSTSPPFQKESDCDFVLSTKCLSSSTPLLSEEHDRICEDSSFKKSYSCEHTDTFKERDITCSEFEGEPGDDKRMSVSCDFQLSTETQSKIIKGDSCSFYTVMPFAEKCFQEGGLDSAHKVGEVVRDESIGNFARMTHESTADGIAFAEICEDTKHPGETRRVTRTIQENPDDTLMEVAAGLLGLTQAQVFSESFLPRNVHQIGPHEENAVLHDGASSIDSEIALGVDERSRSSQAYFAPQEPRETLSGDEACVQTSQEEDYLVITKTTHGDSFSDNKDVSICLIDSQSPVDPVMTEDGFYAGGLTLSPSVGGSRDSLDTTLADLDAFLRTRYQELESSPVDAQGCGAPLQSINQPDNSSVEETPVPPPRTTRGKSPRQSRLSLPFDTVACYEQTPSLVPASETYGQNVSDLTQFSKETPNETVQSNYLKPDSEEVMEQPDPQETRTDSASNPSATNKDEEESEKFCSSNQDFTGKSVGKGNIEMTDSGVEPVPTPHVFELQYRLSCDTTAPENDRTQDEKNDTPILTTNVAYKDAFPTMTVARSVVPVKYRSLENIEKSLFVIADDSQKDSPYIDSPESASKISEEGFPLSMRVTHRKLFWDNQVKRFMTEEKEQGPASNPPNVFPIGEMGLVKKRRQSIEGSAATDGEPSTVRASASVLDVAREKERKGGFALQTDKTGIKVQQRSPTRVVTRKKVELFGSVERTAILRGARNRTGVDVDTQGLVRSGRQFFENMVQVERVPTPEFEAVMRIRKEIEEQLKEVPTEPAASELPPAKPAEADAKAVALDTIGRTLTRVMATEGAEVRDTCVAVTKGESHTRLTSCKTSTGKRPHKPSSVKRRAPDPPMKFEDQRVRFERAKTFFKQLEEPILKECAPRIKRQFRPTFPRPQPYGCTAKRQRRMSSSVEAPTEVQSAPTSDTDTSARVSGSRRLLTERSERGGSERMAKVAERFHVKDVFQDVLGSGSTRSLKGIPHRKAVLAALSSMDSPGDTSPYDSVTDAEDDDVLRRSSEDLLDDPDGGQSRGAAALQEVTYPVPRDYQKEYPYLPTTPIESYRPRSLEKRMHLIPRRDLLDMDL